MTESDFHSGIRESNHNRQKHFNDVTKKVFGDLLRVGHRSATRSPPKRRIYFTICLRLITFIIFFSQSLITT